MDVFIVFSWWFQMLSLSEQESVWMFKHLGHSMNVHEMFYRQHSDVLEKAKVAKLLILADSGKMENFLGKKLEDINFEGSFFC